MSGDQLSIDPLAFVLEVYTVVNKEFGPPGARGVPIDEHGVRVLLHLFG